MPNFDNLITFEEGRKVLPHSRVQANRQHPQTNERNTTMGTLSPAQRQVQRLTDTAKRESKKNRPNAHEHWLAAVALSSELLGSTNPQTSFCVFNAAEALIQSHKAEEAISLLQPHLRNLELLHGRAHYSVENMHQSLARAYRAIGSNVSQLKHWLAAAHSAEKRRGIQHNTTLYCYHSAARTYLTMGLCEEAQPLLVTVLSTTLAKGGPQIRLGYIARDIANCLVQRERYEDAIPFLKFAIQAFDDDSNNHRQVRGRTHATLVRIQQLLEEGQTSE